MAFIAIEGLDGAGKSTQIDLLAGYVTGCGAECEYLHFPRYDSPVYGDLIGRFLRGEFGNADRVDPFLAALLFAGDRAAAAGVIRDWLAEGKTVLVDRYVCSNVAFQCAKVADPVRRRELRDWILDTEYVRFGIPRPDVSVFLDVPFGFTARRLTEARSGADRDYLRGAADIHESSLDLQCRVREEYLSLACTEPRFRVVDCAAPDGGMLPPDEISRRVRSVVAPYL